MNKTPRIVDVLLGLGYGVLVAAFVGAAVLVYNRAFVPSVDVTLTTGTVGSALQKGSDVKLHGVPVGEVKSIDTAPGGAQLHLQLDPDTAKTLPADTTARLLPKTLFGERYVALQVPTGSNGSGLSDGAVIQQDTTHQAVELEEVFDQLLPLLQSIQPEKLSATLGELSTLLRGRGGDIGDTMAAWGDYLKKLNPQVPQITEDFDRLARVATTWGEAAPDLLDALDSFTTNARTLVAKRSQLADVYANVITGANTTRGWVSDNQDTIEILSDQSRKALEATAPYAREFPCLLKAFAEYIPEMDRNLGKGTDEPGIHVRLNVVESRGKYVPGRDKPKFSTGGKARCPYVTGQTGTQPVNASISGPQAIAPPPAAVQQQILVGQGLGPANSPGENQLIAELMAKADGTSPADYPAWGSLVMGPALRGAQVSLR